MGHITALGLAEEVGDLVTLKQALAMHLQGNHYPPINLVFVDTCVEAINYAASGDWDIEIEMPNRITKTVASIVEELHLDPFIPEYY